MFHCFKCYLTFDGKKVIFFELQYNLVQPAWNYKKLIIKNGIKAFSLKLSIRLTGV